MKREGLVVVLSGFSGAGKGTLVKELLKRYDNYCLSVSATTRAPREGEQDGREYFFVTKEHFEELIRTDGLIEYAAYVGNYYGTPRRYVEEKRAEGRDILLEIEIQGAMKIRAMFPDAVLIFVTPPDAETLRERLSRRGTETKEQIEARLRRAAEESGFIRDYDYLLVNDRLDAAVEELHHLIQTQHCRMSLNRELAEEIAGELNRAYI